MFDREIKMKIQKKRSTQTKNKMMKNCSTLTQET